jgi:hypothetical protein
MLLGGCTVGVGVRGEKKLSDREEGVGVDIEDDLAVGDRVWPAGTSPLYNEPIVENRWAKRGIMIEARLSSKAMRLLYDMDWYTEDSGTPSAYRVR